MHSLVNIATGSTGHEKSQTSQDWAKGKDNIDLPVRFSTDFEIPQEHLIKWVKIKKTISHGLFIKILRDEYRYPNGSMLPIHTMESAWKSSITRLKQKQLNEDKKTN